MKSKGYQIDELPSNSKELMEKVINNPEAMDGSPELNIAHKMSVKEYEEFTPYSPRLEENWGNRLETSIVTDKTFLSMENILEMFL